MSLFHLPGTTKNINRFLTIIPVYFLALAACTIKSGDSNSDETPANNTQISLNEAAKTDATIPFPHPKTFKNIEEHGLLAITFGRKTCATCHGSDDDTSGGSSGISCRSCHSIYPHTENIISRHGALWQADEKNTCVRCHESSVHENISASTKLPNKCSTCHQDWPHPRGWLDDNSTEFHGIASLRAGNKTCQRCHKEPEAGLTPSTSAHTTGRVESGTCSSCHEDYPHQRNFGKTHGSFLAGSGGDQELIAARCQNCHSPQFGEGSELRTKVPTCLSCHPSYPHPQKFATPGTTNFHGEIAKGSKQVECLNCHKATSATSSDRNENGIAASNAPQCASCHSGYPHSENWLKSGNHGAAWLADQNSCIQCHKQAGQAGVEGFCQNCHNFPHPKNFILQSKHPQFLYSHGFEEGQCLQCHNETKQKTLGLDTCESCHNRLWKKN